LSIFHILQSFLSYCKMCKTIYYLNFLCYDNLEKVDYLNILINMMISSASFYKKDNICCNKLVKRIQLNLRTSELLIITHIHKTITKMNYYYDSNIYYYTSTVIILLTWLSLSWNCIKTLSFLFVGKNRTLFWFGQGR